MKIITKTLSIDVTMTFTEESEKPFIKFTTENKDSVIISLMNNKMEIIPEAVTKFEFKDHPELDKEV